MADRAQPSPTIAQCLNGGYGWLQVKCHRCETEASIPLDAIRQPRNTPMELEGALKCRSCRPGECCADAGRPRANRAVENHPARRCVRAGIVFAGAWAIPARLSRRSRPLIGARAGQQGPRPPATAAREPTMHIEIAEVRNRGLFRRHSGR